MNSAAPPTRLRGSTAARCAGRCLAEDLYQQHPGAYDRPSDGEHDPRRRPIEAAAGLYEHARTADDERQRAGGTNRNPAGKPQEWLGTGRQTARRKRRDHRTEDKAGPEELGPKRGMTLAGDQPDDRDDDNAEEQQNRLECALGKPLRLEYPLDVDRDGDEHKPSQRPSGACDSNEQVRPLGWVIRNQGAGNPRLSHTLADASPTQRGSANGSGL